MCGRYLFQPVSGELLRIYQLAQQLGEVKIGEIFPSENVPTIGAGPKGEMRVAVSRWGFTGFKKSQLLINARSETVTEKAIFAESFFKRRCLIPMNGFYEWNSAKERLLFEPEQANELYVGAIYRVHQGKVESIILTTEPNDDVAPIHDRMPLIIAKEDREMWLNDTDFALDLLSKAIPNQLSKSQQPKDIEP